MKTNTLRAMLVATAIEWHKKFGNAPAITGTLAEYDAAMLVGCSEDDYRKQMESRSMVAKGHDFSHGGKLYQVKSGRPSGRKGSVITLVGKPSNYFWDFFIWIRYDKSYDIEEAWCWTKDDFKARFESKERLNPDDMRGGRRLAGRIEFERFGVFPK
jgi:hypothetical protein